MLYDPADYSAAFSVKYQSFPITSGTKQTFLSYNPQRVYWKLNQGGGFSTSRIWFDNTVTSTFGFIIPTSTGEYEMSWEKERSAVWQEMVIFSGGGVTALALVEVFYDPTVYEA